MIIGLFIVKVAVGCLSGGLVHQSMKADTWGYHRAALKEYTLLKQHPGLYCTNLFTTGYTYGHEGFLQTKNSYWNDLKDNLIVKFISVLHIFSGGRYYVNVVLYNFLLFFGLIAMYKLYKMVYPSGTVGLIVSCFLLPSFIFFTSTIHKEGVIAAAIGMLMYNMYHLLYSHTKIMARLGVMLICCSVLLFLRNYVLLALVPAIITWYCIVLTKANKWVVSAVVYLLLLVCFFNVHQFFVSFNLLQFFVQKQTDFLALSIGNTTLPIAQLSANWGSFVHNLPQAMQHAMARPFITDYTLSIQVIPFAVELVAYQMLLVLCIFCHKKTEAHFSVVPFIMAIFGVSLLVIIGYIVPAIGEIIRYRSVYLPFIIIPVVQAINWQKLQSIISIKK